MRLLLVGKTGGGRSATGNSILGRCAFESKLATKPVTLSCQKADGLWNGQDITVIDTANIFYLWDDNAPVHKEILQCIRLSFPGPHALLLVTQLGRFTQEDQEAVKGVQDVFGSSVLRYTIVVFTRGEELVSGTLDDYVTYTDNRALRDVIQSCGYRYCSINNRATSAERDQQVQQLMEKVVQMVQENEGKYYSNEMYLDPGLTEEKVMYHVKMYREDRKSRELPWWRKYSKCLMVVGGGVILTAACPRLAMLLARALRAAAALRPALPPRRPLSSLPPRALLPPPPLARSLWQRSDGGGWRGALLRPRRGSAGGVSCGCGGLHTEGDKAFAQFLTDEIKEERKIQKHKALPKVSGGWELEVHGTEARLVRKVAGEKITVTFNINNSIPPAVDDEAPEEQKPDEQEEPDITSTPNFVVEVIKDDTKQTLVLDCHYPEDEVGHEGEEESDIFTIREVSFQPTGESDWKDTNYTLNTDSLDWALYDHLMDFLADRGVDNTFADELIELSTALEHQEYIKFLEDLKSFVKCQ